MPGGQHALQRDTIGIGHLFACRAFITVGFQILSQLFGLHRTTPGALGEVLQMRRDHFRRGIIRRHHILASCFFRVRHQRAFPFDPIEQHGGEQAVSFVVEHLRGVRIQERGLAAVCEDVTAPAAESAAEGRALAAVHHIRGHHAEVQRCGHFEKHLELIHLGFVFRRGDVELHHAIHRFFTRALADAQMGGLSAERADAAGLDAKLVKPAVLRPDLTEPVGRERILSVARKQQVTQRPLDAEAVQRRLLVLAAIVADVGGGLVDFARLGRGGNGKGAVQHQFRRAVVAIHM